MRGTVQKTIDRRVKLTAKIKLRILRSYDNGLPMTVIARRFDMNRATVSKAIYGVPPGKKWKEGPFNKCACGCGGLTAPGRTWIQGHNQSPWVKKGILCTEEQRRKISEAVKRAIREGRMDPVANGKKHKSRK
jgi:hypothetical protein